MVIPVGKSKRIPETKCPNCESIFSSVSSVGDSNMREGAIMICIDCGYPLAFDHNLELRELTQSEMVRVSSDRRIETIQLAIKLAKK